jgi:DNA polymerase I
VENRPSLTGIELHQIETIDDILDMKRWASERRDGPLCFDVETEGLDPFRHKVRLIQLGDERHGWTVPFNLWGGAALEILQKYEGEFAGHNASFDMRMLQVHAGLKMPWSRVHDTMILSALDKPDRSHGLKELSTALIDTRAMWGQKLLHDGMRKNGWTWATVPIMFPPYGLYAAMDTILTAHLWKYLYPRVMVSCPEVYDMERSVLRVCHGMMLRGMRIDRPYVMAAIEKMDSFSREARGWLSGEHGIHSPLSPVQITDALANAGMQVDSDGKRNYLVMDGRKLRTPTGAPKIDKDILKYIQDGQFDGRPVPAEAAEVAKYVLGVRKAEKISGSYLRGFLAASDSTDRVHPQIRTLEARTGRMSCTDPPVQTLSRDNPLVRGCFIPDEGNVLLSVDASQIEARIAAALSNDAGMIKAFAEADAGGRDFYSGIASELFGENIDKHDSRRQLTKNMNFCKIYGGGVAKMATTVKLPVERVKPINDAFDARFPGIHDLMKRTSTQLQAMKDGGEQPAVRTALGRYLPVEPDRIYSGLNYLIQASAAEALKAGLLDIDAAGFGGMTLCPVHDEVVMQAPVEDAEDVLHEVSLVLSSSTHYTVPIPWEGVIMRERWAK